MKNIEWEFVIPLKDDMIIDIFEIENAYSLPSDFKEFIKKNNSGMPLVNTFDTDKTKERNIKCILSFNKEDEENIYEFINLFKKNNYLEMLPFAIDSFGNFICFENEKVVFWNCELETKEYIADSFSKFLDCLY